MLVFVLHAHAAIAGVSRGGSGEVERSTRRGEQPAGRRLNLPPGIVIPYASTSIVGTIPGQRGIDLGLGAFWGVAEDLQVDAHLGPIHLGPAPGQGPHRLAITGGLVHTKPFELAGTLSMSLDTSGNSPLVSTVQPGVVAAIAFNERIWFEAGGHLPVSTGPEASIGLSLPVRAHVAISGHVEARLDSGLAVKKLGEAATVPLGVSLRYKAGQTQGGWFMCPYVSGTQFYTPQTGRVNTSAFSAGVLVGVPLKR
ncbi:hypothetical protein [Polyangium aurulentum]|uniref:hypothetical protein n=1 Tax=Polyangium aurulentum TaxID=2567896 RepID=UPI0020100CAB|nr:hypothetical protein [Polyangium aurulentum]UQA60524.1 hypothetical protein E8A73_008645 [Polyangium aurulentum]